MPQADAGGDGDYPLRENIGGTASAILKEKPPRASDQRSFDQIAAKNFSVLDRKTPVEDYGVSRNTCKPRITLVPVQIPQPLPFDLKGASSQ
ncbi:hypothetical protein MBM_05182 [Drepanopeziza brunnea f. sp. 'multigermtubi' MB_m1]|uniref:Uncharacterized protein n=1 Tax=Marssonina brunnea f. sp. multigermtubi (strain MB_m1) TaxID=1072389 RepID=K1X7V5_MARBU|nr:uncharacterized protein MBM_05182 [Drepanopeziza brunnea f. sp. 'multigermtubi' MB_m1]EKD16713.1 hypothetical protein MBM_05182 [Drepanopeziza brunnea f. sp. 'multigermtubi' MB_m1]